MASYSRCLRDIGKGAVVVVVEELAGQALVGFWMTVELLFGGTAARLGGSVPDDVIRDEQVQPTIVVVIEPAGRYRPHAPKLGIDSGDACPGGDVGEAAVAEVAVEDVALDAGDEDIGVAIVIVVENGDSAARQFDLVELARGAVAEFESQAGLGGHLLKTNVRRRRGWTRDTAEQ